MPRISRIALFLLPLLLRLLLCACRGSCDGAALRTELEDLEVLKTRLLIDLPDSPHGSRRLMYLENRNGNDALMLPERWALGFSGPLITFGPITLRGILAQLYNPLAQGAGSEVFAAAPGIALNIDLDVGGRRGLQLRVVPDRWNLIGVYDRRIGAQFGSVIKLPLGRRMACNLAGLLSAPPDRLEEQQSWYGEDPLFSGGLIGHLAGTLTWRILPYRLCLAAGTSAGPFIGPGTFAALQLCRRAPPADLDLLLGYCSPAYFTPEGESGDLQWLVAMQLNRDFEALNLSAGWRRELLPLPPSPVDFRESRDLLNAGIGIRQIIGRGWTWILEGDAEMERQWSPAGERTDRWSLHAGSTLQVNVWSFTLGLKEKGAEDCDRLRDALVVIGCEPSWGEAKLEAGYRIGEPAGFNLGAALEVMGEGRRIYLRLETAEVLPLPSSADGRPEGEWLQQFSFRVGWEVKSRKRVRG